MKRKALLILTVILIVILLIYAFDKADLIGDPAKGVVKDPAPPVDECCIAKDTVEIKCYKLWHYATFSRRHYALNPKRLCLSKDQKIVINHKIDISSNGKHIEAEIIDVIDTSPCK